MPPTTMQGPPRINAEGLYILTKSAEYQELSEAERKQIIQVFKESPPEEQDEMVSGLTGTPRTEKSILDYPTKEQLGAAGQYMGKMWRGESNEPPPERHPNRITEAAFNLLVPQSPKQAVAMGVGGAVGGIPGRMARQFLSKGAATGLAGTVIPDVAGSVGGYAANIGMGLEERSKLGDYTSVGVPGAVRGVGALAGLYGRFSAPARAMRANDVANERFLETGIKNKQQLEYLTRNYHTAAEANQAKVEAANAKLLTAWNAAIERSGPNSQAAATAREKYTSKLEAANEQKVLKDTENQAKYERALSMREDRIKAHREAALKLESVTGGYWEGPRDPKSVTRKITEAYDLVEKAGNPRIRWDRVRASAKEVMEELEGKFEDFRDHSLYRTAKSFHDLGVTEAKPGTTSSVLGPEGKPALQAEGTPRTVVDPRFSEVRPQISGTGLGSEVATYRNKGGEEYGLVKKLYGSVMDAMETGGETNAALKYAKGLAKRKFALEDIDQLFTPGAQGSGVHPAEGGGVSVNPQAIREGLARLKVMKDGKANKNFLDAFEPGELQRLEDQVEHLIQVEAIRNPPGTPTPAPLKDVKVTEAELKAMTPGPHPGPLEVETTGAPPEISPDTMRGLAPGKPPQPTLPEYTAGNIMRGGAIGGTIGGVVGAMQGYPYRESIAAGSIAGIAASTLGRWLAHSMLKPQHQHLLRKMMGDDLVISPEHLALLGTILRVPKESKPVP